MAKGEQSGTGTELTSARSCGIACCCNTDMNIDGSEADCLINASVILKVMTQLTYGVRCLFVGSAFC